MSFRALVVVCLSLLPGAACALGLIVPQHVEGDPGCVDVLEQAVRVTIDPGGARAVTTLRFRLAADRTVDVLALTEGAVARLDGAGVVLDRLTPRAALDRVMAHVERRRDPALLDAASWPMAAGVMRLLAGEHVLEVEGAPAWDAAASPARLEQPLRLMGTACWNVAPAVEIDLGSAAPLGAFFTPFHEVQVERADRLTAHLIASADPAAPPADLLLYATAADAPVAADVVSFRAPACTPAEADVAGGFAVVLAGPTAIEATDAVAKDIAFVIDTSGSMDGEKIRQVQGALRAVLEGLGPEDRFELVPFADTARAVFGALRAVGPQALSEARAVIDGLVAGGSTNISEALLRALGSLNGGGDVRPRMAMFLTDGQATAGETDVGRILDDVVRQNEAGVRIFAFGVGNDVNTTLLDGLGRATGATTHYIQPGQPIDATIEAFYRDVQAPLVTGLEIEGRGVTLSDRLPIDLPDLFVGSRLLLTGRYAPSAQATLDLRGMTGDGPIAQAVGGALVRQGTAHAWLPRLWASRQMGELLFAARQNGGDDATVEAIRALAWRYGFVTQWTPFQVDALGRVNDGYSNPTDSEVGGEAVGTSAAINEMGANSNAGAYYGGAAPIRQVLDRTFIFDGTWWVDTAAPEGGEVIEVAWLSADWRRLAATDPALRSLLAVGRDVVLRWQCRTVRVTDPTAEDAPAPTAVPEGVFQPADGSEAIPGAGPAPVAAVAKDAEPARCSSAPGEGGSGAWAALLVLGVVARRRRRR